MRRSLECLGESYRSILHRNELNSVPLRTINISKRGVVEVRMAFSSMVANAGWRSPESLR